MLLSTLVLSLLLHALAVVSSPTNQVTLQPDASAVSNNHTVPAHLFDSLEELARLVDISYCVTTAGIGITSPFRCLSRCAEFEGFELVTTWNTGPLMSDSSGYIALSHPDSLHGKIGRIVVAFRGTYSVANTIADLSTVPQEYVPYPGDDGDEGDAPKEVETPSTVGGYFENLLSHRWSTRSFVQKPPKCEQCEVHMGFYRAWRNTRDEIMPYLDSTTAAYPKYELTIVGHSLGGAVAALAALDFETHGWHPSITTFGEPRIGNAALAAYVDDRFGLNEVSHQSRFRRVTHIADPVPMLPLDEWGYMPHGGEVFVSAVALPPAISDMRLCSGSQDPDCLAGHEGQIPTRYKLWELFFAHRDYFHRIGLCVPGGDPSSGLRPPTID